MVSEMTMNFIAEDQDGSSFVVHHHNLYWPPGFDVTVQLDLSNIPDNWEEIVKKWVILQL